MTTRPELPFELEEELDRPYLEELAALQVELLELQAHVVETGRRVLVVCEGRDAAGKGGAILRFTQNLNPRHLRVVALSLLPADPGPAGAFTDPGSQPCSTPSSARRAERAASGA